MDGFLEAADVPRGLRIVGSEDSLDDLIVVNRGPSGGRDRKWFADQWPPVASVLCRNGGGGTAVSARRAQSTKGGGAGRHQRVLLLRQRGVRDRCAVRPRLSALWTRHQPHAGRRRSVRQGHSLVLRESRSRGKRGASPARGSAVRRSPASRWSSSIFSGTPFPPPVLSLRTPHRDTHPWPRSLMAVRTVRRKQEEGSSRSFPADSLAGTMI